MLWSTIIHSLVIQLFGFLGLGVASYQEDGAVVVQSGTFTAYCTEFIGNTGSNGGGIHIYTGSVFVHHCNFVRNRATGVGGAIAACACRQRANITITDSTFSWNTAGHQCGAVHFLGI